MEDLIIENGRSYSDNAKIKAEAWYDHFNKFHKIGSPEKDTIRNLITSIDGVIADDVGISVPEWGGFPGKYTHRLMKYFPVEKLQNDYAAATQHAAVALRTYAQHWDYPTTISSEKYNNGILLNKLMSDYPIYYMNAFVPDGYKKTYTEMPFEEMCSITPRYYALLSVIMQFIDFIAISNSENAYYNEI